jgi:uncharacterized protein YuzE
MSEISFNVTYDRLTDVLYISALKAASTKGVEDKYGIVWRYGADGNLVGATVVDFRELWSEKTENLAKELAWHFEVPTVQALNIIEHALDRT